MLVFPRLAPLYIHTCERYPVADYSGRFFAFGRCTRFLLAKKVSSPWYIHKWVSQQFLRPKHILADSFPKRALPKEHDSDDFQ